MSSGAGLNDSWVKFISAVVNTDADELIPADESHGDVRLIRGETPEFRVPLPEDDGTVRWRFERAVVTLRTSCSVMDLNSAWNELDHYFTDHGILPTNEEIGIIEEDVPF